MSGPENDNTVSATGKGPMTIRERLETSAVASMQQIRNVLNNNHNLAASGYNLCYNIIHDLNQELTVFREWEEHFRGGTLTEESNAEIMDRLTALRAVKLQQMEEVKKKIEESNAGKN